MNSDSPKSKKPNNLVDLQDIRVKILKEENQRLIDIYASYVIIEQCLLYLNMNKLPELLDLKKEIDKSLKKLRKIHKNGR